MYRMDAVNCIIYGTCHLNEELIHLFHCTYTTQFPEVPLQQLPHPKNQPPDNPATSVATTTTKDQRYQTPTGAAANAPPPSVYSSP